MHYNQNLLYKIYFADMQKFFVIFLHFYSNNVFGYVCAYLKEKFLQYDVNLDRIFDNTY